MKRLGRSSSSSTAVTSRLPLARDTATPAPDDPRAHVQRDNPNVRVRGDLDALRARLPDGVLTLGRAVAELYEQIGLFREPLGGLDRELATVAERIGELALAANPMRGAVKPGTEPGLEATDYFGPERGATTF